ncbi:MAG: substrate-binding domain-containing protein [Synergistaceae bacterium]|jgi:AI-2 transport system substrate-binding protein|nr:substrate-binding domain-containing protein [Synergistaceae bacterium]
MRKTAAALLIMIALAQAFAARASEITVVFIPKVTGNAFFEAANDGAQAFAAKEGFKVSYKGNAEADVRHQIAIIDDAIRLKADAICISALDAAALDTTLKRARRIGVKVTTWDSDAHGDARSIMVSQGTPSQLGRMLVEMGAKSLISRGKKPSAEKIKYAWHYSQASVTDQNSWRVEGERYIKRTYPNWENVAPGNYYSDQDPQKAFNVGKTIFTEHPDIDLIICNDSTSLPGQAAAAKALGKTAKDVTVTGFASPNAMKGFCRDGIVERWGLWDCQVQGALGCYMAYYLASGHDVKVGDKIRIPNIGTVEVMPNTVLDPQAYTAPDSGVILLPHRVEFTKENMDEYNF